VKRESIMSLEEWFCSRCGANLKCPLCGGSGKQRDLFEGYLEESQGKYCCGQISLGDYCSICGKSLKPADVLPKKEKRCINCNGTGKILHQCGF